MSKWTVIIVHPCLGGSHSDSLVLQLQWQHWDKGITTSNLEKGSVKRISLLKVTFIFILKRTGTRRHYHDDGISDEEIDGRRTFDLEEKVNSQRFSSEMVNHMEGKGKVQLRTFYIGTFMDMNESWVTTGNCSAMMAVNWHIVQKKKKHYHVVVCLFCTRFYIWVHPEKWSEETNHLWEAWWIGNQVFIFSFTHVSPVCKSDSE